MKNFNWKNGVEFVGIAAIIASLIFVGVQVQQDRKFAQAQSIADMMENLLNSRSDMNEFAHVLAKGNSGAQLDATESLIVRNIVASESDLVFLQAWRTQIGGGLTTNTPELIFAVFLYQNPAARESWLQIDADMETLVDPLRSPESMTRTRESGSSAYRSRVKTHLARLDDLSSK